jgi:hypothetical protein
MCTITFIPQPLGRALLTQNRDESPHRPKAVFPHTELYKGQTLVYPRDPQGQGSWLATNSRDKVYCLMNGAYRAHESRPPYRKSRGLVLLEALKDESLSAYLEKESLEEIEPFTLLALQATSESLLLEELKWDGRQARLDVLPTHRPHIWSAPKLYTAEQHALRESWFAEWLAENPQPDAAAVINFHQSAGDGNPQHSLLLARDYVRTLSTTQAELSPQGIRLRYLELNPSPPAQLSALRAR